MSGWLSEITERVAVPRILTAFLPSVGSRRPGPPSIHPIDPARPSRRWQGGRCDNRRTSTRARHAGRHRPRAARSRARAVLRASPAYRGRVRDGHPRPLGEMTTQQRPSWSRSCRGSRSESRPRRAGSERAARADRASRGRWCTLSRESACHRCRRRSESASPRNGSRMDGGGSTTARVCLSRPGCFWLLGSPRVSRWRGSG